MQQEEIIIIIVLTTFLISMLIAGIIIFTFQYRKRKLLHNAEKKIIHENHARETLTTQLEIQQQTMQQIGREIHDNVGQKLTLASLYAQQIDYEKKYPEINDRIIAVANIINESLSELRSLSKNMINDHIKDTDLLTLLRNECNKINAAGICIVNFSEKANAINASYTAKNIILRIVQEFLQNSLKHSGCTEINISIQYDKHLITLYLNDNGKGFLLTDNNSNGVGINNIKKRSAIIGASIKLESNPGMGTSLTLAIPAEKLL